MSRTGLADARTRIVALTACVMAVLACNVLAVQPTDGSAGTSATARIESAQGGAVALADGARLEIPPGAMAADGEVSLRIVERGSASGGEGSFTTPVGSRYEVDLSGQELAGPMTLEIPFNPNAVPAGVEANEIFLAYFDEAQGEWVFAGGQVDPARNVIVLEVDHASWWEPATWNWEAWAAALNGILSANVVSMVEGVGVLLDDCPQEGAYVSVNASGANGLIQGCVERDEAKAPELRLVNPKGIYVEVLPMAGWAYFEPTLLAPGESLHFKVDTGRPSPLVISADVSQKAGWRLVIHMSIAMLPGFNQLRFQGETVACLTEALADVAPLASAAEALLDGKGAAAAEHLTRMYLDEDAMRRFRTGAVGCKYGPAATWSLPGIRIVGASLATIQSSFELIGSYSTYRHGEVAFHWGDVSHLSGEIALLEACLERGYVCMPLPLEIGGPVDWIRGVQYDPAWEDRSGPPVEYLGLNPPTGTVVVSPFEGRIRDVGPGGFIQTIELPSQRTLELDFWFAGYHQFDILIEDETQITVGEPIAQYAGLIPWTPGPVGPDFEYPGIIQISVGYGGDYEKGMPVYPVVEWDPQVNVDPSRDVEEWMVTHDCRTITYRAVEGPTAIFDQVIDLLHRSDIHVDPEPESFFDLSPPLALGPPVVSSGSANRVISGDGDTRYFTECIYMIVWDMPVEGSRTIVYESTAEGGRWKFESPLKRFVVWSDEG